MRGSAVEGSGPERPRVSGGCGTNMVACKSHSRAVPVHNLGLAMQIVPLAPGWRRKQGEQRGEISGEDKVFSGCSCSCVGSLQFAGVEVTLGADIPWGRRSF